MGARPSTSQYRRLEAAGRGATKNRRGDFTFDELVERVKELFGVE